jgi:rhamnosyltransferase
MNGSANISVIIPVKNGAPEIRACIEGILAQSVSPREIIAIDSGSTDETPAILVEYPAVRVIKIPADEFNHGDTRNFGVNQASGEFLVFTVQDARAYNRDWIAEMLRGFTDPGVAAVCGAQVVPHERDKNPVEWFRPCSEPRMIRYQFGDPAAFQRLSPQEKLQVCSWDNVTAMYRRMVLLEQPFARTSYAEDILWAKEAILRGHALAYNPGARVYHFHTETTDFAFRRSLAATYHRYRALGYLSNEPNVVLPLLRALRRLAGESAITWRERLHWARYTLANQLAMRSAVRTFRTELSRGDEALDELYQRHCGNPPVPGKPSDVLNARV